MMPTRGRKLTSWRHRVGSSTVVLASCFACLAWSAQSLAQVTSPRTRELSKPPEEQGVRWNDLDRAQQATLKPLERQWSGVSGQRKQKWLELAKRFPKMSQPEQARVQERMGEWARLTPQERGQARLNFQEAKQLPVEDRQARWDAYQALSPEKKQQLAARAAPTASAPPAAHKTGAPVAPRVDDGVRERPLAKSNIVPGPTLAASPKAVEPTVVQARPGATTTLITKRPTPPLHQQAGLPKIAATPEFVNQTTLQPQRGPQGAATRSAAASAAIPSPQQ